MKLIEMPPKTYTAKLFQSGAFKVAGTLDGFIDLSTPNGIYPLSLAEAQSLITAMSDSVADVKAHCLYDCDPLLERRK